MGQSQPKLQGFYVIVINILSKAETEENEIES